MQSQHRIKDARGRSVSALDPVSLHVLHRYNVIEADTLEQIVEELEPGTAKRRRQLIILIPCAVVALAIGIAALYYFSDASARRDLVSTLTNPVIMVPNVVCCLIVPWIVLRAARMKRAHFAMLKHQRCPHCGYNLHGLPVAMEDGATVCPECGCAWALDIAALDSVLASTAPGQANVGRAQKGVLIALGATYPVSTCRGVSLVEDVLKSGLLSA